MRRLRIPSGEVLEMGTWRGRKLAFAELDGRSSAGDAECPASTGRGEATTFVSMGRPQGPGDSLKWRLSRFNGQIAAGTCAALAGA